MTRRGPGTRLGALAKAIPGGWDFPHVVVVRVLDGDTVEMDVDLGFSLVRHTSWRLLGLNARELEQPGGPEAHDNLTALLPVGTAVHLTSAKDDKFAPRYDGRIILADGTDLNQHLIDTYWAAPWNGQGPKPVPPWPRPVAATPRRRSPSR